MTVRVEKALPPLPTILAHVDHAARQAANRARQAAVPVVRAGLPVVSGRLRRGTTGRVSRTPTGYALTVAATSRVRYPSGVSAKQVLRFVTQGTGVFGPLRRRITPRRASAFVLPGWSAESVSGQQGRDYLGQVKPLADGIVVRSLEDGAVDAADFIERAL
jgi:hypothetical protein